MNNKNLMALGVAAVVLGAAACFLANDATKGVPKLNGQPLVPAFDVEKVAKIEIGDKLVLAALEWEGRPLETVLREKREGR